MVSSMIGRDGRGCLLLSRLSDGGEDMASPCMLRREMLHVPQQHRPPLIPDREILSSRREPDARHSPEIRRACRPIPKCRPAREMILLQHFSFILQRVLGRWRPTSFKASRLETLAVARSSDEGWKASEEMGWVRCSSDRIGLGLRYGSSVEVVDVVRELGE